MYVLMCQNNYYNYLKLEKFENVNKIPWNV